MRVFFSSVFVLLVASAFAEKQPFERYQPILDRQMFGRPPVGFDPTKPPSEVTKSEQRELTKEQESLKSAIHFSMINVTPSGETAVGFTDNSDPKKPVHYYLKVGEKRNGWEVREADPVKATMTVAKGDLVVPLELGANSAAMTKGGPAAVAAGMLARGSSRPSLLTGGGLRSGGGTPGAGLNRMSLGSLRERRAAREEERKAAVAAAEAKEKAEKAEHEKEREAQRQELQNLKDELNAQREAMAREKAAREAQEREESSREAREKDASDAGDES